MLHNNRNSLSILFAGHQLQLMASGACYWPQQQALIVSDLHLEKGSYFASRGHPIPLTDTRDTLEKLHQEIMCLQPKKVICLGDNVHDAQGFLRMNEYDLLLLEDLCTKVDNWLWIIGNHDTANLKLPTLANTQFVSEIILDHCCFTHDFKSNEKVQIIGHYHPKISIKRQNVKITGKCFSVSKSVLIMPSFGSYTGGLDVRNKVFQNVLPQYQQHYLLYKEHIFLVK